MRIGAIPESLIEKAVCAFGLLPEPLLIGSWGMSASRCLIAGANLGVFEALASGGKTAPEVAKASCCDPAAMQALLNALNGFGFLRRRKGRYENARQVERWLLGSSRFPLHDSVVFFGDLWNLMGEVEERVRTGRQANIHHAGFPPDFWRRYIRGLACFARFVAPEIVRRVGVKAGPKSLLDVGGGHGVFSMAFCRRHEGLNAEVLDLPAAVEVGMSIVQEQKMEERVKFRAGDLREAEWGNRLDVILIFNVIHNLRVEEIQRMLGKALRALSPGGTLAILDSEYGGGDKDVSAAGGFGELMFFLTSGAKTYPEETIRGWVAEAGFSGIRTAHLLSLPMAFLLTAGGRMQGPPP